MSPRGSINSHQVASLSFQPVETKMTTLPSKKTMIFCQVCWLQDKNTPLGVFLWKAGCTRKELAMIGYAVEPGRRAGRVLPWQKFKDMILKFLCC
jgi:hypothetical protein